MVSERGGETLVSIGLIVEPAQESLYPPNCPMCRNGEGHPAYALHTHLEGRQTSLYVPDELVEKEEGAVQNRKKLQELLVEVGCRYVNALKARRIEAHLSLALNFICLK